MANSKQCPVCKKETRNPTFCSRSCAATFNNKKTPKRKPEGACHQCGVTISRSKTLCAECNTQIKQEAERKSNNIHILKGPQGQIEKKLPRDFSNNEYFIFENGPYKKLIQDDTCDTLVDYLLSLIVNDPPAYIPSYAKNWLPGMLLFLLEKKIKKTPWSENKRATTLGKLPIRSIASHLENWIWSLFDEQYHPLLPIFALATCQFIDRHLFGFNGYHYNPHSSRWEIEPWLKLDPISERRRFYFLDNSAFKKRFTENIKGVCAIGTLSPNVKIILRNAWEKEEILSSSFELIINRCHLSQAPAYDHSYIHAKIIQPEKLEYDIFSDFKLPSIILSQANDEGRRIRYGANIPASWIIAAKIYPTFDSEEIIPLPDWLTK